MRIAIYGAGSLGTVLGAYLTKNGVPVDLVNHNRAHVEALRKNGAHIAGTVDFTVPVSALLPEEISGKYDIIFLMTKQLSNREVVTFLKDYLAEDVQIDIESLQHIVLDNLQFGLDGGTSITGRSHLRLPPVGRVRDIHRHHLGEVFPW